MLWITSLRQVKISPSRQAPLALPDIKAEAISVRINTTVFDYPASLLPGSEWLF
jgi:hypothetical protein